MSTNYERTAFDHLPTRFGAPLYAKLGDSIEPNKELRQEIATITTEVREKITQLGFNNGGIVEKPTFGEIGAFAFPSKTSPDEFDHIARIERAHEGQHEIKLGAVQCDESTYSASGHSIHEEMAAAPKGTSFDVAYISMCMGRLYINRFTPSKHEGRVVRSREKLSLQESEQRGLLSFMSELAKADGRSLEEMAKACDWHKDFRGALEENTFTTLEGEKVKIYKLPLVLGRLWVGQRKNGDVVAVDRSFPSKHEAKNKWVMTTLASEDPYAYYGTEDGDYLTLPKGSENLAKLFSFLQTSHTKLVGPTQNVDGPANPQSVAWSK